MTLGEYCLKNPNAKVRVTFRNDAGQTGELVCTLDHALNPNASGRYFPTQDDNGNYATPAEMGWPVPCWYQEEVTGITLA